MEVTNDVLLCEIEKLKGWILFLMAREEEVWIQSLTEPFDETAKRQEFRKRAREFESAVRDRGRPRTPEPTRKPGDDRLEWWELTENVTPLGGPPKTP